MRIKIITQDCGELKDGWITIMDIDNDSNILYEGIRMIPTIVLCELFETIAPDLEQVILEEN